jgi:isochorismate synthase
MFEQIKNIIQSAIINNQAFVVYRMPQDETVIIQIQNDNNVSYTSDFKENGFVFSPFDLNKKTIILRAVQSTEYRLKFEKENVEFKIKSMNLSKKEEENHIGLVAKTINFITSEKAKKIVISRKQVIPLRENDFETKLKIYVNLLNLYPEAYVYWWNHPKVGIWMGATPEKFIQFQDKYLVTMSLAGTQLFKENIEWGEKEIEEQEIVTQYISKQIQEFCEDIQTSAPFTKKSGHLAHICTLIAGKLNDEFNLKSLIERMHPTPAVCGNPKEIAKSFILKNEGYDRKFYTGFLGKIENQPTNKSDLYVNLRCMEWTVTSVNLYVGGGITAESIPEREWEETVNKAQVLAKIFK